MRAAAGKFRKSANSQQPAVEGVAAPTSVSAFRANDYDENHAEEIATGPTEDDFDNAEPLPMRRTPSRHTKGRRFAGEMLQANDDIRSNAEDVREEPE